MLERMPVKIGVVIHEALKMVESLVRQKHMTVNTDIPEEWPTMRLPQSELVQVLTNLIQNAIEASPEHATVSITVEQTEDQCWIKVTDSGPGIPPELCKKIFDPFFTTKHDNGKVNLGVGLSVSNSFVQAMGGEIELTSLPGEGTTFAIVLPMEPGACPT